MIRTLLLWILLLSCALPAEANIPPAPQAFSGLIYIQVAIVLFSLIGGAYTVMNRRKPQKKGSAIFGWTWRSLLAVLLVFIFSVPEVSFIIALVFGYIAIKRGIMMLSWSKQCGVEAKPEFEGLSSKKLLLSGSLLAVSTLVALSLVFMFYQPWYGRYKDDQVLLRILKGKLLFGAENKHANGHAYYSREGDQYFQSSTFQFIYGKDDESFTILVLPDKLPPFPYNQLVSMPTFRADQTGQIRMLLAHNNFQECPADAPVVHVVDETERKSSIDEGKWTRRRAWEQGKPVWNTQ